MGPYARQHFAIFTSICPQLSIVKLDQDVKFVRFLAFLSVCSSCSGIGRQGQQLVTGHCAQACVWVTSLLGAPDLRSATLLSCGVGSDKCRPHEPYLKEFL